MHTTLALTWDGRFTAPCGGCGYPAEWEQRLSHSEPFDIPCTVCDARAVVASLNTALNKEAA